MIHLLAIITSTSPAGSCILLTDSMQISLRAASAWSSGSALTDPISRMELTPQPIASYNGELSWDLGAVHIYTLIHVHTHVLIKPVQVHIERSGGQLAPTVAQYYTQVSTHVRTRSIHMSLHCACTCIYVQAVWVWLKSQSVERVLFCEGAASEVCGCV